MNSKYMHKGTIGDGCKFFENLIQRIREQVGVMLKREKTVSDAFKSRSVLPGNSTYYEMMMNIKEMEKTNIMPFYITYILKF